MIFPRKGRKCWVVVTFWERYKAAQGTLTSQDKGIWEVRIRHGGEEFFVVADKCDIYGSRWRAERAARRRKREADQRRA